MAAATLRRMRQVAQAKLPFRPGVQVPGESARPLVLALLFASATMSSGKGGAAAGRAWEDSEGSGAGEETGRVRARALPRVWADGVARPEVEECAVWRGLLRRLRSGVERCRDHKSRKQSVDGRGGGSGAVWREWVATGNGGGGVSEIPWSF